MTMAVSRRGFFQASAAATFQVGLAGRSIADAVTTTDDPPNLTVYQDGPQIWVRWGGRVLTSYRAHPTQKYPYFYPLAGPTTGLSLTTESSLPWPHHRSLFFGCDRAGGANFWQGPVEQGQIVSTGPKLGPSSSNSARILDQCEWRVPGQPAVLADEREFSITVSSPQQWYIDARIRLTARQPVQVTKTNHSLFAVRAAPDLTPSGGGSLVSSDGKSGEKATFGQPAAWCDFSGCRTAAGNVVEGIALMDHPSNPWSPCKWFTRDYGFISPTPFNWLDDAGWQLPEGQSVTLNYRVVLHAGDAKDADLVGVYKAWSTRP